MLNQPQACMKGKIGGLVLAAQHNAFVQGFILQYFSKRQIQAF